MLNKHNFVLKYYDVLYGRLSTYQYPLVTCGRTKSQAIITGVPNRQFF
jgi:hypothetical protein